MSFFGMLSRLFQPPDHLILRRPLQPAARPCHLRSTDVGTDYIYLEWDNMEKDEVSHYEIRMREAGDSLWSTTIVSTQNKQPCHRFNDLLQNTGYEFMVRAVYSDGRDSDFSCKSAKITTKCSEVSGLLKYCQKINDGPPSTYRLPLVEVRSSKDDAQKTRKCIYGNSTCLREKTILMVGPRRGGKTTLINGLVNYSLGVNWEHEYRLKITDEPEISSYRQESPTQWITSYKVHPVTENIDFILNIIDTPGFNVGPESDESNKILLQRLKFFLPTRGPKGMNDIDTVCFISQANPVEFSGIDEAFREILDGISSIFGDKQGNIIPMLTFSDGKEPSVLKTLSAVGVPTERYFVFNSSTLFPPYTEDALLGKALWELNSRGFEGFLNTKTTRMTSEHLWENDWHHEERTHLQKNLFQFDRQLMDQDWQQKKMTHLQGNRNFDQQLMDQDWQQTKMTHLQGNRFKINLQLMDLANVQSDRDTVKKFAIAIQLYNSFTYDEEVYREEKIPLEPGKHVTNCIVCHTTCHYPCGIPDNAGKINCAAMNNGYCTVCHQKCVWHVHRNDTFRIVGKFEKVTRTYADMKTKYEFNVEENVSTDAMLQAIKRAFVSLMEEVISLISKTVETSNSLQNIQQNEKDYIELMIDTEEQEKKPGYEKRLELLRAIFNNSNVYVRDPNTWLQEMGYSDW